jgi:hypothetical protein
MSRENSRSIIFYSLHCSYCKDVLNLLSRYNLHSRIQCVNIDKLKKIPNIVKHVPTLYRGHDHTILIGEQVFHYIEDYKKNMTSSSASAISSVDDEPNAWHSLEMGNHFSDNYSFLEDSSRIPHTFMYIGEPMCDSMSCPVGSSTSRVSEKESELNKRYEMLKSERNQL